jgi:hypothetical protein
MEGIEKLWHWKTAFLEAVHPLFILARISRAGWIAMPIQMAIGKPSGFNLPYLTIAIQVFGLFRNEMPTKKRRTCSVALIIRLSPFG